MKKWMMVLGGVVLVIVAIILIVIFAGQVLEFLQGIVGILAGLAGAILLFIGVSDIRADREMQRQEAEEKRKSAESGS